MKFLSLAWLTLACAASLPGDSPVEGFVHLPVSRHSKPHPNNLDLEEFLVRRDSNGVDAELLNNQSFYAIEFQLGTPPQQLSLLLDTGSSDVWVLDQSACNDLGDKCTQSSTFNSNDSSSFHNNHTRFFQQYADSTEAFGEWAQDNMKLGGSNISDFNFAVAERTNSTQGTAGIGLAVGETPYILNDIRQPYSNLPMQLKEQGMTQRVAYSLWLNRNGANAGSVLFGAIDHAKLSTDIYTMPLVPTEGLPTVSRFAVKLTGLSIYDSKGNEQPFASCAVPAVLDSGSTISSIPEQLIMPFYEQIGAEQVEQGIYLVDCSLLSSSDGGLGLQLGGIDVTVGFSDLFVKLARDRSGSTYCVPGFQVGPGLAIIGDNILRTLYVVYDLEALEVGIAAAETGSAADSSSSIEVLSTTIPGTRAANNSDTHLNSNFATTSITLMSGSHKSSFAVGNGQVSTRVAPPEQTSQGGSRGGGIFGGFFGGNSMSVPSSVPESIVIGAKTSVGKAANSQGGSSPTGSASGSSGTDSKKRSKSKNHGAVAGASSLLGSLAALVLFLV